MGWTRTGSALGLVAVVMGCSAEQPMAHGLWLDRSLYPYAFRDPANPRSEGRASAYDPVTSGARSYRPVDPLPWSDVNKRVSPPESNPAMPEHRQ